MPTVVVYLTKKNKKERLKRKKFVMKNKEELGQGKLVIKYNTICVKINKTYYKLNAPNLDVQLWSPVQRTTRKKSQGSRYSSYSY